jgi:hypothetical protein
MSGKPEVRIIPTLAWAIPAFVLAADLSAARADELADLRANQELLQQRLDQLSQAAAGAPASPIGVGSFPRSFLIPGTDTSMRVGGQAVGSVLWYIKGAATGGDLNGTGGFNFTFTDGQGSSGNLSGIPLKAPFGTAPNTATAAGYAYPRSQAIIFSGRQSQIYLDVRQPSAYGEIKAFVSFDFFAANTNTILNNNNSSTNGYIPRLRDGYATFDRLLMGQTAGTFLDNDSSPELLDFSGQTGIPFVARTGQVRYTYPLPNGMSIAIAAEQPEPQAVGPFGQFDYDTNEVPTLSACPTSTTAAPAPGNNTTNACLGNAAFFDPLTQIMPTMVLRWRIDQPWGHLQAGVTTVGYGLQDGRYLNRDYIGYGGSISGHFFTRGKDNLGGGLAGGDGIGDQIANGSGLATNFGGALNGQAVNATSALSNFNISAASRALYDSAVLAQTVVSFSARIYYQHWWTDQLRSSADFSVTHNDIPAFVQASGRAADNKELDLTHLNLMWSPMAFVDVGVEGAWGHCYTLQTAMKVRF